MRRFAPRWLRRLLSVFGGLVVVVVAFTLATTSCLASFGAAPTGDRLARIERSPHYASGRFENREPTSVMLDERGGMKLDEWLFPSVMRRPPCPLPAEQAEATRQTLAATPSSGLRATWLGHSTLLLEIDGVTVLTDPVFSEFASPSQMLGPRRFHPPPLAIHELPHLDAVVLSHDHYDHTDMASLQELSSTRTMPFLVPLGVGSHLERWGIDPARIREHDWGDHSVVGPVTLVSTPARHFSGRSPVDQNRTLWTSWVIKGPAHRVYFSGDTGLTPAFQTIGDEHGPFDVAFLEVGAWNAAWGDIHLGPSGALKAFSMLNAIRLWPIHWGTFDLGLHAWSEPPETLLVEAGRARVDVLTPVLGRPVEPTSTTPLSPWWRALPPIAERCPPPTP